MSDWSLTASKLKTFGECEEQFRLKYIERLGEMGPPNRWIRRGNAVHEAIEDVLNESSDPSVSSVDLKSAYRENGGRSGYELSEDFHEQVLSCLDSASRYLRKNVDGIRDVELEVLFGVDKVDVTRDFYGFIDVTTTSKVVDWKTGKSDGKDGDDALQGAVYMAGYTYEYGEPPEQIDFVYLNPEAGDDHPKVRSIEPDDDLWNQMIMKARFLLATVDSEDYSATVSDDTCNWCDQEPYCSYSPVGAGSIDWEVYP